MIDVSCAILIDKDGKILATQRSASMPLPLKWEFPGGKVESGETAEESLLREIKEELDISIKITGNLSPVVHAYGVKTIRLIPFTAVILNGEINLKEHLAYCWLNANELKELDWAEADVPVLKELLAVIQID
jgi:8-oxo-dGTP diphosphatase